MSNAPAEWQAAGIRQEAECLRLVYNRHSGLLIAQFRRETAIGASVASLYARTRDSSQYLRLTDESDCLSYEDPVSASQAPALVTNVLKWADEEGGEWHGITRINLAKGAPDVMITETDLKVSPPYLGAWVTTVHSAWDDGRGVVCTIAFERSATEAESTEFFGRTGARRITTVESWLCDLNIDQKKYERILQLMATHF